MKRFKFTRCFHFLCFSSSILVFIFRVRLASISMKINLIPNHVCNGMSMENVMWHKILRCTFENALSNSWYDEFNAYNMNAVYYQRCTINVNDKNKNQFDCSLSLSLCLSVCISRVSIHVNDYDVVLRNLTFAHSYVHIVHYLLSDFKNAFDSTALYCVDLTQFSII